MNQIWPATGDPGSLARFCTRAFCSSFWASDWCNSAVVRFDLASGTVLESHVANAAGFMVKRIGVRPNRFTLSVTNTATVTGGGEANATGNTASDQTIILFLVYASSGTSQY